MNLRPVKSPLKLWRLIKNLIKVFGAFLVALRCIELIIIVLPLPLQVYSGAHGRTMIFCPTKKEANEMALSSCLKQDCQVLHGDIPQRQREITLKVCAW